VTLAGADLVSVLCPPLALRQSQSGRQPHYSADAGADTTTALAVPAHKNLRVGTINSVLRVVSNHKGVDRQAILDSLGLTPNARPSPQNERIEVPVALDAITFLSKIRSAVLPRRAARRKRDARQLLEDLLSRTSTTFIPAMQADLLTCYGGRPRTIFKTAPAVKFYRVTDYPDSNLP